MVDKTDKMLAIVRDIGGEIVNCARIDHSWDLTACVDTMLKGDTLYLTERRRFRDNEEDTIEEERRAKREQRRIDLKIEELRELGWTVEKQHRAPVENSVADPAF